MPLNYLGPDPVNPTDVAPRHAATDLLPGLTLAALDAVALPLLAGNTVPTVVLNGTYPIPTTATQIVTSKTARNALNTTQISLGQAVVINQGTDAGAYLLIATPASADASWWKIGGKATKMYVDARDALLADLPYAQAGDATRVHINDKDAASGVLALGASGKANANRFNVATTQQWPQAVTTPAAYNGTVTGITADTALYPIAVADPGYPYKVVVYGSVEAFCPPVGVIYTQGQYVTVTVRQGDPATGAVIGSGQGGTDAYSFIPPTQTDSFPTTTLDSTKWATVPGTPYANLVVDLNGVQPQNNQRNLSRWIGPTPGSDRLMVRFTPNNLAFGALRIYACALESDWTSNAVMIEINRTQPTAGSSDAYIYTPSGVPSSAHGTQRAHGDISSITVGQEHTFDYDPTNGTFGTYSYRIDNSLIVAWTDPTGIVTHGAGKRGVAMMTNASLNVGSFIGWGFDDWSLSDPSANAATSPVHVIPVGYASAPVITGATTLYVRANRGAGSTGQSVTSFHPNLTVMTVPA